MGPLAGEAGCVPQGAAGDPGLRWGGRRAGSWGTSADCEGPPRASKGLASPRATGDASRHVGGRLQVSTGGRGCCAERGGCPGGRGRGPPSHDHAQRGDTGCFLCHLYLRGFYVHNTYFPTNSNRKNVLLSSSKVTRHLLAIRKPWVGGGWLGRVKTLSHEGGAVITQSKDWPVFAKQSNFSQRKPQADSGRQEQTDPGQAPGRAAGRA